MSARAIQNARFEIQRSKAEGNLSEQTDRTVERIVGAAVAIAVEDVAKELRLASDCPKLRACSDVLSKYAERFDSVARAIRATVVNA